MKKTTYLILIGIFAFEALGAAQTRILIDLDVASAKIDSIRIIAPGTLTIGIYCNNVVNLDSYSFDVAFNPAVLSFQTAAEDNSFAGLTNILKKNGGQTLNVNLGLKKGCTDTININSTLQGSDSTKAPDGDGLLGIIQFNVIKELPCTLSLHNVAFLDYENVKASSVSVTNGTLTGAVSVRQPKILVGDGDKPLTRGNILYPFFNEYRNNNGNSLFDIRGRRVSAGIRGNFTGTEIHATGMYMIK